MFWEGQISSGPVSCTIDGTHIMVINQSGVRVVLRSSSRGFSLLVPEGITTIVFDNVPRFGVDWIVEQLPAGAEVTVTINSW